MLGEIQIGWTGALKQVKGCKKHAPTSNHSIFVEVILYFIGYFKDCIKQAPH